MPHHILPSGVRAEKPEPRFLIPDHARRQILAWEERHPGIAAVVLDALEGPVAEDPDAYLGMVVNGLSASSAVGFRIDHEGQEFQLAFPLAFPDGVPEVASCWLHPGPEPAPWKV